MDDLGFTSQYASHFLRNKHVVIIGDSVQRGVYKDLILFLQEDRLLLNREELKKRCECTFLSDRLTYRTEQTTGTSFIECREYQSKDGAHLVQYYFLTRCYNKQMVAILEQFEKEPPDLVIMNSCMWDISRYGPQQEERYKQRLAKLLTRMRQVLPMTSQFLWTTALPLASRINCTAWLSERIKFQEETLRASIIEANNYVSQIMVSFGFDVLDLHYYFRALLQHREPDGVHWNPTVHRHVTNMVLVFLHDSWGVPLPTHVVQKLQRTDLDLNLPHFRFDGVPTFVDPLLKDLTALSDECSAAEQKSSLPDIMGTDLGDVDYEAVDDMDDCYVDLDEPGPAISSNPEHYVNAGSLLNGAHMENGLQ